MLLDNLIIADWHVVSVIPKPGNLRMEYAFKVPFFDYEKFPYVIFDNGHHLLNLQDKSIQILVKADCASGFCIQTGDRAFDLHFTSSAEEKD